MNPNTIQFWCMVLGAIFQILAILCAVGYKHLGKKADILADNLKTKEFMNRFSRLETALYDRNNNKVLDFTGVEVL